MGVSRTRSSPKRSRSPLETWKMPPISPTSSPMRKTRSSRAISPWSAALSASADGQLAAGAARGLRHLRVRGVDRGLHDLHGGLGALAAVGHGGVQLAFDTLAQLLQLDLARAHVHEPPLHAGDGVLLHPLELFLPWSGSRAGWRACCDRPSGRSRPRRSSAPRRVARGRRPRRRRRRRRPGRCRPPARPGCRRPARARTRLRPRWCATGRSRARTCCSRRRR